MACKTDDVEESEEALYIVVLHVNVIKNCILVEFEQWLLCSEMCVCVHVYVCVVASFLCAPCVCVCVLLLLLHTCILYIHVHFIHLLVCREPHIFSLKINEAEVDEMKLSLI